MKTVIYFSIIFSITFSFLGCNKEEDSIPEEDRSFCGKDSLAFHTYFTGSHDGNIQTYDNEYNPVKTNEKLTLTIEEVNNPVNGYNHSYFSIIMISQNGDTITNSRGERTVSTYFKEDIRFEEYANKWNIRGHLTYDDKEKGKEVIVVILDKYFHDTRIKSESTYWISDEGVKLDKSPVCFIKQ